MKVLDFLTLGKKQLAMLQNEVKNLHSFSSDHIVKIYDVYESPSFCYLMMELCPGGDLFRMLMYREQPFFEL